jgi:arylsulfatase A-like enzyme
MNDIVRGMVGLVAVLLMGGMAVCVRAAERPNVVVIITDDQGYGDLSIHGNPVLRTPHLDQLAREGVRLNDFHVSPVCSPTRASLLTGRYSLRTGVRHVSSGMETMRADEVTLAELFQRAGYRTALFGKWHNGENYPYTPRGQGFTTSLGYNLGHWNNYFDTRLKRDQEWVRPTGFIVDVLTQAAIEEITAHRDQPFFCYVSLTTPHSPFQVPEAEFAEYKAKGLDDKLACIYGMCANVDANVGRLLKALDELGLREKTVVVFLTDNGPNGERYNAGMRGAKGTLHQGGTRVPCFVRWPGVLPAGRVIEELAAHIDLLPTLTELCGVPVEGTKPLDGRSLVPLLKGSETAWPERPLVIQWMDRAPPKAPVAAVRTERHRLVGQPGKWQLYDLESDPGEMLDLATRDAQTVETLAGVYDAWWQDVSREIPTERFPIPVGYAEEPRVELSAAQSTLVAPAKMSGRHHNNAWVAGWTAAGPVVRFDVDVVRAGRYRVGVDYGMPPMDGANATGSNATAGPAVAVIVTAEGVEQETRGTLPFQRLIQVASPDRVPREEVYEMRWASGELGELVLPIGRRSISLAREEMGDAAHELNLRELRLTWVGE